MMLYSYGGSQSEARTVPYQPGLNPGPGVCESITLSARPQLLPVYFYLTDLNNKLFVACHQPKAEGTQCKTPSERYFFNPQSGKCESFVYGGCDGNKNNYESLAECESSCGKLESFCDIEICSCLNSGFQKSMFSMNYT